MKRILKPLNLLSLMYCVIGLNATTFYLDPVNGSNNNNGTIDAPLASLQEVVEGQLILSYKNSPLPYDPINNELTVKNSNGIIHGGDTLLLLNGYHGDVFITNYNNKDYITVIGQDKDNVHLRYLRLQGSSMWKFENLTVTNQGGSPNPTKTLVFLESHNWQGPCFKIDIDGCNVFSSYEPWKTAQKWLDNALNGIDIRGDSINITNCNVRNIYMGISSSGDFNNVINNQVVNFGGDGMRLIGSYNLFENNTIKNCYNINDNHDDGIQSFTTGGQIVDHNIIRSNTIINYEDPNQPLLGTLQGIGCFDGFFRDWIVENNVISVNHWHGITFLGADSVRIYNNTVLDPTPEESPGPSWIMIDNHKDGRPSVDVEIRNNVSNTVAGTAVVSNNVMVNTESGYAKHFVDYSTYDFHLIESSSLIDMADPAYAPKRDRDNVERKYGSGPDIGAYEYIKTVGYQDTDPNQKFKLYPSPTHGVITLEGIDQCYGLAVYSSTGRLQFSMNIDKGNHKIDVSGLDSGFYHFVFRLLNNKNEHFSVKVIKL